MSAPTHAAAESAAVLTVLGVLTKTLPALASFLAIIWYAIVIWEHPVGKRWRLRWHNLYVAMRERRALTVENKLMLLFLGLAGTGFFLVLYAVERVMQ